MVNGHLFLTQSTDTHRTSTLLMQKIQCQLCCVRKKTFPFEVKKAPSVDSMSMFPAPDKMNCRILVAAKELR